MSRNIVSVDINVTRKLASYLTKGDYGIIEVVEETSGSDIDLTIARNDVMKTAKITLNGGVEEIEKAFIHLIARLNSFDKFLQNDSNNQARINHLQMKLDSLREKASLSKQALMEEQEKRAQFEQRVFIPDASDSDSSSSSDSEILYGSFNDTGYRTLSKAIGKIQVMNRNPLSSRLMKVMLSKFISPLARVESEAAITFEEFKKSFVSFIQIENANFRTVRSTKGFEQSLRAHLKGGWSHLCTMKESQNKLYILVAIDFPK